MMTKLRAVTTRAREIAGQTDVANAARLIQLHGNDLHYVGPWSKWIIWDGQRWVIDDSMQVESKAKDVAKILFEQLDENSAKAEFAFAKQSANVGRIKAMVALAAPELAIRHDDLDRHGWLLNLQNGTIDLRTGEIRLHCRSDDLTKISPVVFNRDAECQTWLRFLNEIFEGDQELIGYMQRLCGYSMTGVVDEHILPVLYGSGANGKTTFLGTLVSLLGADYSTKLNRAMLMTGSHSEHATQFADLFGARFAYSEETGDGARLAEAVVKDLTGGGRVKARRMRENFWEFPPTHKIWLSTNHKPEISGTDYGIWRRMKLIPFNVKIPDGKQDGQLGGKLKQELSGILNWCLAGCLAWQANGLEEPSCVTSATADYREESDVIGNFLAEYCLIKDGCIVAANDLYEAFKTAGGTMTQKAFAQAILERGFTKERPHHGQFRKRTAYRGLGLLADQD